MFSPRVPRLPKFLRLKEQEARLELITAEQGSNVNHLVSLVKENKELQTKMQVSAI